MLNKIYSHYNVDPKILASLWGIETSYGSYLGNFDILSSLASLAYDGRRKNFFLKQLRYALKILEDGHISKSQFKGLNGRVPLVKLNLCLAHLINTL